MVKPSRAYRAGYEQALKDVADHDPSCDPWSSCPLCTALTKAATKMTAEFVYRLLEDAGDSGVARGVK